MKQNSPVVFVGPSSLTLLTILFTALKLTNQIGWPWVWVLSPLWLPLVPIVIIGFAFLVLTLVDYFRAEQTTN